MALFPSLGPLRRRRRLFAEAPLGVAVRGVAPPHLVAGLRLLHPAHTAAIHVGVTLRHALRVRGRRLDEHRVVRPAPARLLLAQPSSLLTEVVLGRPHSRM